MKKLKALQKNESGVILVYVLLALALGGIIIGPLLGFMGTGLKASQTHAVETELLYSSEAGIQDAFWRIQNNSTGLPRSPADPALQYTLPDSINGKTISVTIERINTTTFKIVATAAGPDNSQSTSIETYAGIVNLTMFTEGAITSPGSVNVQPNGIISGDIYSPSIYISNQCQVDPGDIHIGPIQDWPSSTDIPYVGAFYKKQVNTSIPYTNASINLSLPAQRGPLYCYNGNPLQTYTMTGNGFLTGTIYVVGHLYLDTSNVLNLNGNTIFVDGTVTSAPGSEMTGPGSIIATGNIGFQPRLSSTQYVYVMSLNGEVNFQPHSDFVGAVAGNADVNLQPGCTLQWTSLPQSGLNLPGLNENIISRIRTWKIY